MKNLCDTCKFKIQKGNCDVDLIIDQHENVTYCTGYRAENVINNLISFIKRNDNENRFESK